MNNENNVTIEKYLNALSIMSKSIGTLESVRLMSNKINQDETINCLLKNVISDLSKALGVAYNPIEIKQENKPVKIIPSEDKISDMQKSIDNLCKIISDREKQYPKPKQTIINIEETPKEKVKIQTEPYLIRFNKQDIEAQKQLDNLIKQDRQKTFANTILETETNKDELKYKFVNSTNLMQLIYNYRKRSLIVTFLTKETYIYYNVSKKLVEQIIEKDKNDDHPGKLFNAKIVKVYNNRRNEFRKITDRFDIENNCMKVY